MEEKYTINIGSFMEHEDRCLSASFGGSGVQTDTIPWEGTKNNPWDYKYVDGAFVLEPIELPTVVAVPTAEERLEALESVLLEMMGV